MSVLAALFEDENAAARSIAEVRSRGVGPDAISVVASERVDQTVFGVDTHSKLPEGAALGAGTGGAAGALIAGFTAVGTLASGGVGLLAAGPVVAALAGAGAGATAGAGIGAMIGAAIPEHEIKFHEDAIERGGVLVGVRCEGAASERVVRAVFEETGASRIVTR